MQDFGTNEGYTTVVQRGAAATGVGSGDSLYGQGFAGVYWYSATGETAKTDAAGHTYEVLQYQTSPNLYGNFGSQQGWSSANGFQILKTSTSDAGIRRKPRHKNGGRIGLLAERGIAFI